MKTLICTILFGTVFHTVTAFTNDCRHWFSHLKITSQKSCIIECTTAPVDMSSFSCHDECEAFCGSVDDSISYSLLKLYGLTADEIKICNDSPLTCVTAYKLSWDAERICLKIYKSSKTNDESDACRHFSWAILLTRSLGSDNAEKILNAHENNPKEPKEERAMDLSNNRLGLLSFNKFKAGNTK